jgi:hypothetical protein
MTPRRILRSAPAISWDFKLQPNFKPWLCLAAQPHILQLVNGEKWRLEKEVDYSSMDDYLMKQWSLRKIRHETRVQQLRNI